MPQHLEDGCNIVHRLNQPRAHQAANYQLGFTDWASELQRLEHGHGLCLASLQLLNNKKPTGSGRSTFRAAPSFSQ